MTNERAPLLRFSSLPSTTHTLIFVVHIARTNADVGTIRWATQWRKYAFAPKPGASYTREVLLAINRKLYRLMHAWLQTHPNPRRGLPPLSHVQRASLAKTGASQ